MRKSERTRARTADATNKATVCSMNSEVNSISVSGMETKSATVQIAAVREQDRAAIWKITMQVNSRAAKFRSRAACSPCSKNIFAYRKSTAITR